MVSLPTGGPFHQFCMVCAHHSYGVFTHTSMGGREVQNQNLQKCMKVVRDRLAEDGPQTFCGLSYHFQHARAAARQFMHRYVIFSQNAPSSQPAMRALAGWPIACIHPASQPRACIMHEDSGCTQIRSWMAMDGWMAGCMRPARTDLHGRIERGLRDGGRRAGPSQGMSDMDGRALRASAITPDGRHPGRTARQPFWPFCGGRAARRISMHGKWVELVPMLCRGWVKWPPQ